MRVVYNFPPDCSRWTVAWKDVGLVRKGQKLLANRTQEEFSVSKREVASAHAPPSEEGVSSKNFLKKCHVEHKRIWGVPWHRTEFKLDAGELKGALFGTEDMIDFEGLHREREPPLEHHLLNEELPLKRRGGMDRDSRGLHFCRVVDMIKVLMGQQQTSRFHLFFLTPSPHSRGCVNRDGSLLALNKIPVGF